MLTAVATAVTAGTVLHDGIVTGSTLQYQFTVALGATMPYRRQGMPMPIRKPIAVGFVKWHRVTMKRLDKAVHDSSFASSTTGSSSINVLISAESFLFGNPGQLGVDQTGLDGLMTQQGLNLPQAQTPFEQVSGTRPNQG